MSNEATWAGRGFGSSCCGTGEQWMSRKSEGRGAGRAWGSNGPKPYVHHRRATEKLSNVD